MSAQPTHTGDVHHTGTDPVHYDEKKELGGNDYAAKASTPDEDEDEDIDALIEEEEEVAQPGNARTIPEEMLQTSTRTGLTSSEVVTRRKKYGLNQMKEEKENLLLKFLGFFIGPIQFVMEVSSIFFLR